MKVLLDTSVGMTNYLDPYYKVKIIGTNYYYMILCKRLRFLLNFSILLENVVSNT